jgi:hypothetical protein
MALSVITHNLKRDFMHSLLDNLDNPDHTFYVGLGRSEPWSNISDSASSITDILTEEYKFRNACQAIHRLVAGSMVVPRYEWKKNTIYDSFDDTKELIDYTHPHYVINNNNAVYICLRQGKDDQGIGAPSTEMPTFVNLDPFELSDGYVWKFLFTISALDATLFMTKNWMPVKKQYSVDSNSTGIEIMQWNIQNAAKPGMISSFVVDSGGIGYSNPVLNVNGTLYPDKVDFWLDSAGRILKIEYAPDPLNPTTLDYLYGLYGANVSVNDPTGSTASVRGVLSPSLGFGADARNDLTATDAMLSVRIDGEEPDFLTGQDFRQIGIIKNPMVDSNLGIPFGALTGRTLRSLSLATETVPFTTDEIIVGSTSGARAWVDYADSANIWYHQNSVTGWKSFDDGERITELANFGDGILSTPASVLPNVNPFTGEILYIENRAPIFRVPEQTEDIKIIIRLDECV